MITIDSIAHRYGCLPSEVMQRATTWDLYVADIAAQHENWQYDQAQGKSGSASVPEPDQLQAMLDQVRKKSL